jgi:iron complex transport system permease protein
LDIEVAPEVRELSAAPVVRGGQAIASPSAETRGLRAAARVPQIVLLPSLGVIFVFAVVCSLAVGAVHVSPVAIIRALVGRVPLSQTDQLILWQIRLPRILAGGIVGAALSVSGLLFQGLFRNPMADPYVLGASGGSVLGAALGIFVFGGASLLGFSAAAVMAFVGAVITMFTVYLVARRNGTTNIVNLLLAGFAISTVLTNSTYVFEVLDSSSGAGTRVLAAWLHGIISTPTWGQLLVGACGLALGLIGCFPLARRLNTLALGEEYAQQLGVAVEPTRVALIVLGALLTAVAVALGGLISFAGLIVPHLTRLLFGADNVRLLPVTALCGAIFLVLADTLARTVMAPTEIPVGILMAAAGGPFFLYLLRRSRRSYSL